MALDKLSFCVRALLPALHNEFQCTQLKPGHNPGMENTDYSYKHGGMVWRTAVSSRPATQGLGAGCAPLPLRHHLTARAGPASRAGLAQTKYKESSKQQFAF